MRMRGTSGLGIAVATGLLLGLTAVSARAQEVRSECRCVEAGGEEIENCRCLRTPDVREVTVAFRGAPRARIGVMLEPEQDAEMDRQGVLLSEVSEGSPADEAGLREGDVVVRVAGHGVLEPLEDADAERNLDEERSLPVQRFLALVRELEPGEEVEVEYLRDGGTLTATVVPEERPGWVFRGGPDFDFRFDPEDHDFDFRFDPDDHDFEVRMEPLQNLERFRNFYTPGEGRVWSFGDGDEGVRVLNGAFDPCFASARASSGERHLFIVAGNRCVDGLHLQSLNPQLAEYFGVGGGVLVTEVEEEAALGLRAGDVIVAIDERAVEEPSDVRRILGSYEADEPVTVTVVRKGEEMQVRGTRR